MKISITLTEGHWSTLTTTLTSTKLFPHHPYVSHLHTQKELRGSSLRTNCIYRARPPLVGEVSVNFRESASLKFYLKLKLIYDRRSVGQSVLMSGSNLEPMTRFFFCLTVAGLSMWVILSNERMGL
jgi:hypothetical protein